MSAIQAFTMARSIVAANNAMYNWMNASNSRRGLLSSVSHNPSFGSLKTLSDIDTRLELDMLTNNLQYKMAKAMLENAKKAQKEEAKRFNVFA